MKFEVLDHSLILTIHSCTVYLELCCSVFCPGICDVPVTILMFYYFPHLSSADISSCHDCPPSSSFFLFSPGFVRFFIFEYRSPCCIYFSLFRSKNPPHSRSRLLCLGVDFYSGIPQTVWKSRGVAKRCWRLTGSLWALVSTERLWEKWRGRSRQTHAQAVKKGLSSLCLYLVLFSLVGSCLIRRNPLSPERRGYF